MVIGAGNRKGLERLARYVCRPPLAKARLEEREDGSLIVTLKRPWSAGTTAVVFSRLELLERLSARQSPKALTPGSEGSEPARTPSTPPPRTRHSGPSAGRALQKDDAGSMESSTLACVPRLAHSRVTGRRCCGGAVPPIPSCAIILAG